MILAQKRKNGHFQETLCFTEMFLKWNISPLQFKKSPPKVPYKAIALATILFLIGSLLIIIGALLLAGYFGVTVSNFLGHTFSCYILLQVLQCHHVKRINVFFLLAHRPDRACPHHRDPCLPAWILPPTDSLLCIKGLPGVLLWWHPRLWWLTIAKAPVLLCLHVVNCKVVIYLKKMRSLFFVFHNCF